MVTIKIEDTDAIQQINQQNECVEKHELEIAEKESQINKKIADSNEMNVIPIFENNSLKPITEDMQDQDLKETGAEGYKHSMKNFFNNLAEAEDDHCNPDDLDISFDNNDENYEKVVDKKDKKESSGAPLVFTDLTKVSNDEISEGDMNKSDTRKDKYLVKDGESFETECIEKSAELKKEEKDNSNYKKNEEFQGKITKDLTEKPDESFGFKNAGYDENE